MTNDYSPANTHKGGNRRVIGDFANDVGTRPILYRDIHAHWRSERDMRRRLASHVLFLDDLLAEGLSKEDEELMERRGRKGLRQRYLRAHVKDHPKVKLLMQLCNQYDKLMHPDEGEPDVRNAVALLAQIGRVQEMAEKHFQNTYDQQIKCVLAQAKIDAARAKDGLPPMREVEAEQVKPADVLRTLQEAGLKPKQAREFMGDDAYLQALKDDPTLKTPSKWDKAREAAREAAGEADEEPQGG